MKSFVTDTNSPSEDYGVALRRIVDFVNRVRNEPLPEPDIGLTMDFAGPNTPGGLMILLLQPRDNHPWSRGITGVIEDCATYRCLREAVHICSAGTLNLVTDVSLLYLLPFLPKMSYKARTETKKKELDELVFDAIRSKMPDLLLVLSLSEVRIL